MKNHPADKTGKLLYETCGACWWLFCLWLRGTAVFALVVVIAAAFIPGCAGWLAPETIRPMAWAACLAGVLFGAFEHQRIWQLLGHLLNARAAGDDDEGDDWKTPAPEPPPLPRHADPLPEARHQPRFRVDSPASERFGKENN